MSEDYQNKNERCWVCDNENLSIVKQSDLTDTVNSENYAITNSDYGITGELSKCSNCGFIQCTKENNVIEFYENLVDNEYENSRDERKIQEKKIVSLISKYKPKGTLLDIGAGSGILVESALEMGYDAEGVEPSKWLHQKAVERGLPVHCGIFPSEKLKSEYDIIVLVDVIEHVNSPKELLSEIKKALKPDGIFVLITPDVNSLIAKILGYKWWHFRVAHIGYFNKKNLRLLTDSVGYDLIKIKRPAWYFKVDYLVERAYKLLPRFLHIPVPKFVKNWVIPVNLKDSILGIYKIKN